MQLIENDSLIGKGLIFPHKDGRDIPINIPRKLLLKKYDGFTQIEDVWGISNCNGNIYGYYYNNDKGEIKLYNDFKFGYESLFCEYGYLINFDTNKLEVYIGFQLNQLDEKERFYTKGPYYNKYYGIKCVKEYDLENLPNNENFINEINKMVEETDD